MADDIEDVSFLPGDNLNRKSVYEPSTRQRCHQLVCSKGRATAIAVICGLFILIVTLLASFARSGNNQCDKPESTPEVKNVTREDIYATNGEIFPWQQIMLPKTVEPISYDIFLHPDLTLKTFSGTVQIKVKVKTLTSLLVLHTKNLTITKVQIPDAKPVVNVEKYLVFLKNEQLAIFTSRKLDPGEEVNIKIEFNAKLVKKLSGFYLSSYKTRTGITRYIGTTQFQPTGARQAFPCFDEPNLKATFKLTIIREPKYITLFNMPRETTEEYRDGLVKDVFQETVKMSSYLVAFVVCDYKYKTEQTKSGVNVTVYAPEDQIDQVDFAVKTATTVLDYYNDLYKIQYPLPKLDLIAIPDFSAGAMENWGLVTYRESAVLYHAGESSDSDRQWVAVVIAHELAHQWFGNLVTMEWWDDTWLNEGFASYVEYLGTNAVDPSLKMEEQFVGKTLQKALARDGQKTSHPIQVTVNNPDQVNEIFDTISYDKGASIIRMLRDFLGKDKFTEGITAYLNQYKYGNARTKDLWTALSKKSSIDVNTVMNTWTQQMGYPVISVSKQGSKFVLTQERFLEDGSVPDYKSSPFGYKWYVPFRYRLVYTDRSYDDGLVSLNMTGAEITPSKEVRYIKGNYGMFGFYRVNYEESMWQSIKQQLDEDHMVFSEVDRAGLLDDVFVLARAGLVKHTVALDLSKYLMKEQHYSPWYAVLSRLNYIKNRLQNSESYDLMRSYFLSLIKTASTDVGWQDTGDPLQKYLRSNILTESILNGDENSLKKGRQLFDDWMLHNKSVSPNLKSTVYLAGIKYGGLEEWKFLLTKYNQSLTPSNKDRYLGMLGESTDVLLLNRLLHMTLEDNLIKHQDLYKVIRTVTQNPSGQLLAWRFLQQNWNKFLSWFKDVSFTLPEFVKGTTSSFSTEFDYQEVERFFKSVNVGPAERAVSTALENIVSNMKWLKTHEEEVTKWLTNNS